MTTILCRHCLRRIVRRKDARWMHADNQSVWCGRTGVKFAEPREEVPDGQ